MPMVDLRTSAELDENERSWLIGFLTDTVSEVTGKSKEYVMVSCSAATMAISGVVGPAAFLEISSIGGLDGDVRKALAERMTALLAESLLIPDDRIYIQLREVERGWWSWKGELFG